MGECIGEVLAFLRGTTGRVVGPRIYLLALVLFSSRIASAQLQLHTSNQLPATQGVPYTLQFVAVNGTPPYSFSITTAPAGFQIDSSGLLSGTFQNTGQVQVVVRVMDSASPANQTANQVYVSVLPSSAPLAIDSDIPNGSVGTPYSIPITVSNGYPPYTYTRISGSFPPGTGMGPSGVFGDTPNTPGTYTFTIGVTDSSFPTKSAQRTYTVTITSGLNVPACTYTSSATLLQPYSAAFLGGLTGTAPYSYAVISGALPPGLSVNASSGVLSGTPTHVGAYTFGLRITDATQQTATPSCYLQVQPLTLPLIASPSGTAIIPIGQALSPVTYSTSGGVPPYVFSTPNGVPVGLTFNAATATLSGTPTSGNNSLTIRVDDQAGDASYLTFVVAQVLDISSSQIYDGYAESTYNVSFFGMNFPGTASLRVTGGSLPPGTSLSTDGQLSGTSTTAGTFTFTITASFGQYSVSKTFSVLIRPSTSAPLHITPFLSFVYVGSPYTGSVSAFDGTAPYTVTVNSGLPPGLSVAVNGNVTGTPTKAGQYFMNVTVNDSAGRSGTSDVQVVVNSPKIVISPTTIPNGTVGQPYSVAFSATGGSGSFHWTAAFPGVNIDPDTGLLSGVPVTGGTYTFTVSVEDKAFNSNISSLTFTVVIAGPTNTTLSLSPGSLPAGVVGQTYLQTVLVQGTKGVDAPITWAISSGSLPPGLTVDTSLQTVWKLSGIPTTPGVFAFHLGVTDANNQVGSADYSVTITAPPISVSPASLPAGIATVPYSADFTATGGTPPYTFSLFQGSTQLATQGWLSSNGALRGTQYSAGIATFTITATDSKGVYGSRDYQITFTAASLLVSPNSLSAATIGQNYNAAVTASGGTVPYTYSISSGSLPNGLALNASGSFSGAPQQAGQFTFAVTARDASGAAGSRNYVLVVAGVPITLGPASLPDAIGSQPYSAQLTASGGTPPYTFTMPSATSWAAGMSVASSGLISGTPPDGSNSILTPMIVATDANGSTGTRTFNLNLKSSIPIKLTFQTTTLPNGFQTQHYNAAMTVTGGSYPLVFAVTTGALPPGISLTNDNVHGILDGTPTTLGSYSFTVTATDPSAATTTQNYQLTIQPPPLDFAPVSLTTATEKVAVNVQLAAVNGTGPYVFSLTGQLPPGLTLSPTGLISGTPTLPGSYFFSVILTDSTGKSVNRSFGVQVAGVALTVAPNPLPDGFLAQPYSAQLTASNGQAPYVFLQLPPQTDLVINQAGRVSGTPSGQPGPRVLSVLVQDAVLRQTTLQIPITTNASPLQISPDSLPGAQIGTPYTVTFSASGGTAPYTFSLENTPLGTLTSSGVYTYTPDSAGTKGILMKVSDAAGITVHREYDFNVTDHNTLLVSPPTLTTAQQGQSFSTQFTVTGGTAPYTFKIGSGALPSGVSLSTTGLLSGTPTQSGSFAFSLDVRGAVGVGTPSYNLVVTSIAAAPVVISTSALPPGIRGVVYSTVVGAAGGTSPYSFTLQARTLPQGLHLATDGTLSGTPSTGGAFAVTLRVTDQKGQLDDRDFNLVITDPQISNSLLIDTSQLSFHPGQGQSTTSQCVAVLTTGASATVQGVIAPAVAWATLDKSQTITPGSFCVTFDPTGLGAGTFSSELDLTSSTTQPTMQKVALTLEIEAAQVHFQTAAHVQQTVTQNSGSLSQPLMIRNTGGSAGTYIVSTPSVPWLTITPVSASIAAGGSAVAIIGFDPSKLDPGVYSTDLTIAGGDPLSVRVDLIVSRPLGLLTLSQSSVELAAWKGGTPVTITTSLVNQGSIFLTPVVAVDGAASWLQAELSASSINPGDALPIKITVSAATLDPGHYSTIFSVDAPNLASGKLVGTVGIDVLASSTPLPIDVQIRGLALTPTLPQGSLTIPLPPANALSFSTTIKGPDSEWLSVSPSQGSVPSDGRLILTASADLSKGATGLHHAFIGLGLSDGTIRSIPVDLYIPAAKPAAAPRDQPSDTVCSDPQSLVTHLLSPGPDFVVKAGRAVPIVLQAETCDALPARNLIVTAHIAATDVVLLPESAGVWSGSWVPQTSSSTVPLGVSASGDLVTPSTLSTTGGSVVPSEDSDPVVTSISSAASQIKDDAVVPGSWVLIRGTDLSLTQTLATGVALPTSLGDVEIRVGDQPIPLYYVSANQVNAVLPWGLQPGVQYQLVLRGGGKSSPPIAVTIAEERPAIFTQNQQGTGQASALISGTATVPNSANPITVGATVELYGSGLGPIDATYTDGQPASSTTLARTQIPVTATVGGVPAEVSFSGLAPGTVGLYQTNVKIPANAPVGDAIEIAIYQKGVVSNVTTVAIH